MTGPHRCGGVGAAREEHECAVWCVGSVRACQVLLCTHDIASFRTKRASEQNMTNRHALLTPFTLANGFWFAVVRVRNFPRDLHETRDNAVLRRTNST